MKIQFEDKSYVEIKRSADGKYLVIVSAKDAENPLKNVTNAVEITEKEFKYLVSDIT